MRVLGNYKCEKKELFMPRKLNFEIQNHNLKSFATTKRKEKEKNLVFKTRTNLSIQSTTMPQKQSGSVSRSIGFNSMPHKNPKT